MSDWLIDFLKNGNIDKTVKDLTGISDDDLQKIKDDLKDK